ncbi:MAG: hypothetical protein CSA82_01475 [Actinobacteria bacterium]|nr:MAG: hypothetical protein CSA82_01475 [Actinomycetota bacterium]
MELTQQLTRDYHDAAENPIYLQGDSTYIYRGADLTSWYVSELPGQIGSSPRYMKRVEETEKAAGLLPKEK